jgi:GNAT superfamily N-acetyltransferase
MGCAPNFSLLLCIVTQGFANMVHTISQRGDSTAVRIAGAADAGFIADCNVAMAYETEGKAIDRELLLAGVNGLLARPQFGFYLIAERAGQAVATLMVTYEWSDWRNGLFWWIQSVYVTAQHRRSGLYRTLYDEVKRLAGQSSEPVCGFRLYVENDNHAAQQTYAALGMRRCDYFIYQQGG